MADARDEEYVFNTLGLPSEVWQLVYRHLSGASNDVTHFHQVCRFWHDSATPPEHVLEKSSRSSAWLRRLDWRLNVKLKGNSLPYTHRRCYLQGAEDDTYRFIRLIAYDTPAHSVKNMVDAHNTSLALCDCYNSFDPFPCPHSLPLTRDHFEQQSTFAIQKMYQHELERESLRDRHWQRYSVTPTSTTIATTHTLIGLVCKLSGLVYDRFCFSPCCFIWDDMPERFLNVEPCGLACYGTYYISSTCTHTSFSILANEDFSSNKLHEQSLLLTQTHENAKARACKISFSCGDNEPALHYFLCYNSLQNRCKEALFLDWPT